MCWRAKNLYKEKANNKRKQPSIASSVIGSSHATKKRRKTTYTCDSLQKSGSENHVSSTTTSGVRGFPLYATAAIEEVKTTRFSTGEFTHDFRTLRVPFTAGSNNST